MAYKTICIRKGPASVLPCQVEVEWSFAKLLEVALTRIGVDFISGGEEPECFLSQDMNPSLSSRVQVMMGFNILECCRINGNYIWYIYPDSREVAPPQRSVSSVLMQSAKELKWPDLNFKTPDEYEKGTGDKRLYDDTIRFLQSKQLGFTGGCHLTSGKEYIKTIQTVLFTLQPHLHTLCRRKANFVQ